jgi:hypothetical protein
VLPVTGWTPHNLRRSSRTLLASMGCPEEIGEAILGHLPTKIVGTYNAYTYDKERRLWPGKLAKQPRRPDDSAGTHRLSHPGNRHPSLARNAIFTCIKYGLCGSTARMYVNFAQRRRRAADRLRTFRLRAGDMALLLHCMIRRATTRCGWRPLDEFRPWR